MLRYSSLRELSRPRVLGYNLRAFKKLTLEEKKRVMSRLRQLTKMRASR